ncbi:ornithine decarboxylase SpeF [Parasutterella excrementihominis]|uniref:ornithine decarboxylase SpeF n=1 Tax=Parasutterella excrementihominis TaxID=487175 RepID=UPI0012BCC9F0|nr:ornithine decarboxylase SpeF [Parasutterella excrementihominis]MTT65184.1 ornithine decarboxylase SpeF [Parasutterella excrementihominis]MTT93357.1 ornithine decarboxylase SpeF [Parasutterella excrementihominis]
MQKLKVAASALLKDKLQVEREVVCLSNADFTEVSAVVIDIEDYRKGGLNKVNATALEIPVFLYLRDEDTTPEELVGHVVGVINDDLTDRRLFGRQIDEAAKRYEDKLLPPFFGALAQYVYKGKSQFDCPGHQGGAYFRRHPAGHAFYDFFGEELFRSDLCNADVAMGDLLIHEGAPLTAQKAAAKVFNADKTYFVLNGTSASNKVVLNAALTPGDLVLYDRNNHKSINHGALLQAGATPIYLETARNPFGFIGGIDEKCFDEEYLRSLVREKCPEKADAKRPFRLAVIQLGTYDGTIYNARQVVDKIGHLCDYILFDSAWVGYEQFIPMMRDCSPLLLELGPEDPGIFVTQSVHKQQAGFSQTSQIHKKDSHIKGQDRYIPHKVLNNAFMMHASTSPFYPLFASLDVNAKMQEGEAGRRLWADCVKTVVDARKLLLETCHYIKPFIPSKVRGSDWKSYPTDLIAQDLEFFKFVPGQKWHSFEGYGENQYFVDPCKFMLTTPGIDVETGEYENFGVPATILANYLRDNGIIPEKNDLNSILFLMTPAENKEKMDHLVSQIARFEKYLDDDAPLEEVLPNLYKAYESRYRNYSIRQLCQEMHDFYKERNIKEIQKEMFRTEFMPKSVINPQEAHFAFLRGQAELVRLEDAEGRVAAEGALPYPPGVLCCFPGEVWGGPVLKYFLAWQEAMGRMPGFAPELQGVYVEDNGRGGKQVYCYVLKEDAVERLTAKGK